jgi:hypothetical protein
MRCYIIKNTRSYYRKESAAIRPKTLQNLDLNFKTLESKILSSCLINLSLRNPQTLPELESTESFYIVRI